MRSPLCSLGLISLPLLGAAQPSPPTPPASRFYVGLGASVLTSQPTTPYFGAHLGPALTAGWQFSPRLALQVSGAYTQTTSSYAYSYSSGIMPTDLNSSTYQTNLLTFPVLLRAELTAPTRRLHVDALAGSTLLIGRTSYHYLYTSQGQTVTDVISNHTEVGVSATLGPALRYTFTPRLEATASTLASLQLNAKDSNFGDRLFFNGLVGVHYCFGR